MLWHPTSSVKPPRARLLPRGEHPFLATSWWSFGFMVVLLLAVGALVFFSFWRQALWLLVGICLLLFVDRVFGGPMRWMRSRSATFDLVLLALSGGLLLVLSFVLP